MNKMKKWFKDNMKDLKKPVSQGGVRRANSCERLFLFSNKWGLVPRKRKYSRPMKVGSIIHALLHYGRDQMDVVKEKVYNQHQELLNRIREGEDLTGELVKEANDLSSAYTTALAVVEIYWNKFPIKDYVETLAREHPITGKVDTSSGYLPVLMILDWIVRDKRTGKVWIRDTKSTGKTREHVTTGYRFSPQCRMYRLGVSEFTEWGKDLEGFILDVVKTPGIKLCSKDQNRAAKEKCTPLEAYVQRVKEWYTVNSHNSKPMSSEALPYTEKLMNSEFVNSLNQTGKLWHRGYADPAGFDRDPCATQCFAWERECPYYTLCSSAFTTWPTQIEELFTIAEPVDRTKEKGEL